MKPVSFLFFILAVSLVSFSEEKLLRIHSEVQVRMERPEREVLYLPSGVGLQFLSFGYQNFVADILWFHTISYFGKHYRGDRNYTWLSHMCSLVAELNPRARHVVEFCGTMLAWEAERPKEALVLLSKAIDREPEYWNYYYLKGFTEFYFLNDSAAAQESLEKGASLPDAPAFVARLAAEKMLSSDPTSAIRFLSQMIQEAESGRRPLDEIQLSSLKSKLRQSIHEANLYTYDSALKAYVKKYGNLPRGLEELVEGGFLQVPSSGFSDPYGGTYYIDPETQTVRSTGKAPRSRRKQ